ncbi:MAG TPA: excinuclease ABC subunit UvrA [Sumerlaeia bacterium]|nr:excinuclease ABC subunit UvrA [Sumerlaeia bacterium]
MPARSETRETRLPASHPRPSQSGSGPRGARPLRVIGASEHNLKNINVTIPRNSLTVITGLSGSGKSSLAFDTIYAEGQRRYVESLSSYARQFLDQMQKPNVEHIEGLSPAISIEQRGISKNPRSTVGTVTEIYDYLRILYASIGKPHCPECGHALEGQTVQQIVDRILAYPEGTRFLVMAPVVRGRKGEYGALFDQARREGFTRAMVDGEIVDLETPPRLNKKLKHDVSVVIDRLIMREDLRQRLTDSIEIALKKAEGLVAVQIVKGRGGGEPPQVFSESMACPVHGPKLVELTPRMFSFNSPYGACPRCKGIGSMLEVDEDLVVPDRSKSISEGAVVPWASFFVTKSGEPLQRGSMAWSAQQIRSLCKAHKIDLAKPLGQLSKTHQQLLLYGSRGKKYRVRYESRSGSKFEGDLTWEGLIPQIERRWRDTDSEAAREHWGQFFSDRPCSECGGARLRAETRAVTLHGLGIAEFSQLSVEAALEFLTETEFTSREKEIGMQAIKEIADRLRFLTNVGLSYLTLDRTARTLAGGEAQRIRLATQVGSQLVGVLYILDEPSIGLHHRDNRRLLDTLKQLRDMGNTVIVVEHDEETIRSADYVVDLGPGAGRLGGEVVAVGAPKDIEANPRSFTGQYLAGKKRIEIPSSRRRAEEGREIVVEGAAEHNLKGIDVRFPLGLFICVTGVSGSGKSTLVNDILFRRLSNHFYTSTHHPGRHRAIRGLDWIDKVVNVDQSPIGRTPRSNPATYIGLFSLIRDLFSRLPEAAVRGYRPGRFSFNVKGGRCENCRGDGLIKIEMHFLPDVYIECEVCKGRRFNRETLEIVYRGRSIADVLEMTVEEALEFFENVPAVRAKLQTLYDVGLGYIHLGQPATTLSGGEAQRVKLSRELSKRDTGRTLYILDEPTTGLHFDDIKKLLEVLNRLVDAGNTVIVIEHHLDVIKTSDWIIDLGPEGGDAGGAVVAENTPEEIVKAAGSYTGRFLRDALDGKRRTETGPESGARKSMRHAG